MLNSEDGKFIKQTDIVASDQIIFTRGSALLSRSV
jgi:hypothetical protein